MASLLPRIAGALFDTPLLLAPGKVPAILAALEGRLGSFDLSDIRDLPEASRFEGSRRDPDDGSALSYALTADGVAIVNLVGSWVNRGSWIGATSGILSYEGFAYQLKQAGADPKVKSIVLDLESPGGQAVGCFEVARAVRELASQKPVTALVNGMAASAAYAIASAATRIVTTDSGLSGSIGVVLVHLDHSGALEKAGVRPTIIHAGAHKADSNPFEALPKDVRADLQAEVDAMMTMFVATVAAGRPGLSEKAIRGTEARVFMGREAVKAGLADYVGSLDSVLSDLRGRRLQSRRAPSPTAASIARTASVTDAEEHDIRADERARILSITGSAEAKGREAPALTLALETDLTAEQAIKILSQSPRAEANETAAFERFMSSRPIHSLDPETPPADAKKASADAWAGAITDLNAAHGVTPVRGL